MNIIPPILKMDLTEALGELRLHPTRKAIKALLKQLPTEAAAPDFVNDPDHANIKAEADALLTDLRKYLRLSDTALEMSPRNLSWSSGASETDVIRVPSDTFSATYADGLKDPWNRELDLTQFILVNGLGSVARILAPDDKTSVMLIVKDVPLSVLETGVLQ